MGVIMEFELVHMSGEIDPVSILIKAMDVVIKGHRVTDSQWVSIRCLKIMLISALQQNNLGRLRHMIGKLQQLIESNKIPVQGSSGVELFVTTIPNPFAENTVVRVFRKLAIKPPRSDINRKFFRAMSYVSVYEGVCKRTSGSR